MFSPPGEIKQPVPSNFIQFICMDHYFILCDKPHCDLLSAQTTYLIALFGGALLDRTIFDLLLCMAHILACIEAWLNKLPKGIKWSVVPLPCFTFSLVFMAEGRAAALIGDEVL